MVARSPVARRMAARGVRSAARNPKMRQMAARAVQSNRGQQMMPAARAVQSNRGQQMMPGAARGYQNERMRQIEMRSMAKGGKVRKTGLVYLHKGERVVPVKKLKKIKSNLNMSVPKSFPSVMLPSNVVMNMKPRNLARTGGKVMKTGPHKVSKGQRVIPVSKVKKVDKILRASVRKTPVKKIINKK
jgi:hypothetical protein